jgi:hypothetical protein
MSAAEYIKETVAPAVVEGLAAVARSSPEDPVDMLGRFLVHYADQLDAQERVRQTFRGRGLEIIL